MTDTPQARPLLRTPWLLVNQLHQQVPVRPELQEFRVFLVDPESELDQKFRNSK